MALREQTVAIAVIGVTGSGKSTFIDLASGSNQSLCNSPGSSTTELQSSTFSLDGRTVTLIDTPGFDESVPSVLDVLKSISEYFSRLYSQGVKFAGVIYMHRAADDRMGCSSRRNFQTFCKFCGDTSLRDVVVVTNKCPEEQSNGVPGDAREPGSACRDEVFMRAVDKGARMLPHDGSQASAHAILCQMINSGPTMSPVKTETLDRPSDLACATTPADAMRELTDQLEHHTKAFEKLCQATDTAALTGGKGAKEVLRKEARNSLERIERIRYDLERLVADSTAEKPPLEDENKRHKNVSYAQRTEAELGMRGVCKLAEAEQRRAEAQQAGERTSWEREKMGNEISTVHAGQKYVKRFAYVAVIFALVCVSRIMLHGSATLVL